MHILHSTLASALALAASTKELSSLFPCEDEPNNAVNIVTFHFKYDPILIVI